MDDIYSVFDGMTEEQIRALLEPYQNQQDVISQQMALAQQLRQSHGGQYHTPWGAALGGFADALGNTVGAYKQSKALDEQKALGAQQQEDAARRLQMVLDQGHRADQMEQQRAMEEFLRSRNNSMGFNTGITNWGE